MGNARIAGIQGEPVGQRTRYAFSVRLEVPGATLGDAQERALRLFRRAVRDGLRQTVTYSGSYRGSWFAMSRETAPPADRVNLKQRRRKLRR